MLVCAMLEEICGGGSEADGTQDCLWIRVWRLGSIKMDVSEGRG